MQLYMYNHGSQHGDEPALCFSPPDTDNNEVRLLAMIEFMLPHVRDYVNPANPLQHGTEFVFYQNTGIYMSIDYVLMVARYLQDNKLIESYLIDMNSPNKQIIRFPNIESPDFIDILRLAHKQNRQFDDGPQR